MYARDFFELNVRKKSIWVILFFFPEERSISVLLYCESVMINQGNKVLEKSFGVSSLVFSLLFAAESLLAGTEQRGYCDEGNWRCSGSSSGSGSGSGNWT